MNKYIKISVTVILIILSLITVKILLPDQKALSDGKITFILLDENEQEVINEIVEYNEGETLYDIISRNYDVVCADVDYNVDSTCSYNSPFGKAILEIENVKTDWYNSFLALYINGEYAVYGVSKLPYEDGDIITFKWTPLS